MAIQIKVQDGVGEVIINAPPVNARDNEGWLGAKSPACGQLMAAKTRH